MNQPALNLTEDKFYRWWEYMCTRVSPLAPEKSTDVLEKGTLAPEKGTLAPEWVHLHQRRVHMHQRSNYIKAAMNPRALNTT